MVAFLSGKFSLELWIQHFGVKEGDITLKEIDLGKVQDMFPNDVIENAVFNVTCPGGNAHEYEKNRGLAWVGKFVAGEFGCRLRFYPQFFPQFALQGSCGGFTGLDLPTGELPFEWMGLIGAPLANEDCVATPENACYHSCHIG